MKEPLYFHFVLQLFLHRHYLPCLYSLLKGAGVEFVRWPSQCLKNASTSCNLLNGAFHPPPQCFGSLLKMQNHRKSERDLVNLGWDLVMCFSKSSLRNPNLELPLLYTINCRTAHPPQTQRAGRTRAADVTLLWAWRAFLYLLSVVRAPCKDAWS